MWRPSSYPNQGASLQILIDFIKFIFKGIFKND